MKVEVSNELYVASVAPITSKVNGYVRGGEPFDFFLVSPIVVKPLIGSKKIIGFAEAITKEQVTMSYYEYGFDGGVYNVGQMDARGLITHKIDWTVGVDDLNVGDIDWTINENTTADRLLKKEIIDEYFKTSPEEMKAKLENVRKKCIEMAKSDDISKVV